MTKAKEITGLDCAADALLWATEVLRVRCDEVVSLREAALDFSDIEGVRSMRIATRRLRTAQRDFAPLLKKLLPEKLGKDLKSIADALGAVRDHDVAIAYLEKLQSETEADLIRDGIEELLKERVELRDAARFELAEVIACDKINDLQEEFTAALDKISKRKKQKRPISFNEAGRDAVADGLQNLLDLSLNLSHPFNSAKLHKLRLAAKRLRYAIELFVACWGTSVEPFAEEIAEMQSRLGKVHDCDLWIESLGKRLEREHKNDETNERDFQTAVWLLSKFVKKRDKEFRSALELWGQWKTNRFAERMQDILQPAKSDGSTQKRRLI